MSVSLKELGLIEIHIKTLLEFFNLCRYVRTLVFIFCNIVCIYFRLYLLRKNKKVYIFKISTECNVCIWHFLNHEFPQTHNSSQTLTIHSPRPIQTRGSDVMIHSLT